jgi:hypothetical protein
LEPAEHDPLRRTVERQDFRSGKTHGYADYIEAGATSPRRYLFQGQKLGCPHGPEIAGNWANVS